MQSRLFLKKAVSLAQWQVCQILSDIPYGKIGQQVSCSGSQNYAFRIFFTFAENREVSQKEAGNIDMKKKAPSKSVGEKPKKWNGIYVTAEEKKAIAERAKATGLSISRYVVEAALGKSVTVRRDRARILRKLLLVEQQLEDVALFFRSAPSFDIAINGLLILRRIEADIHRIASGIEEVDLLEDDGVAGC
jgi:hypothetical protein